MMELFYTHSTMEMVRMFRFTLVDDFYDDINREDCFDSQDMDGVTPNYKFILATSCPQNINDCIDADGTLNDNVEILYSDNERDGECALLWSKGINRERTISISTTSVSFDFGDLKPSIMGIFLVNIANGSGYVLAYSIRNSPYQLKPQCILPVDGMVWSIKHGTSQ